MKNLFSLLFLSLCLVQNVVAQTASSSSKDAAIDRQALVARNNPHVVAVDTMASLNVGNGNFSFTADVTGLQSFPELYKNGVPLGTMSGWGWHSFPNTEELTPEETLDEFDFGHGHKELYATQFKVDKSAPAAVRQRMERKNAASNYFRANPHRLHLGVVGFDFKDNPWRSRATAKGAEKVKVDEMMKPGEGQGDGKGAVSGKSAVDLTGGGIIRDIDQRLDMMDGALYSKFRYAGKMHEVTTVCHPKKDLVSAVISTPARTPLCFRFPYPTGGHSDDGCLWGADEKHSTVIAAKRGNAVVLQRVVDETTYFVTISWEGEAFFLQKGLNYFTLNPKQDRWAVNVLYEDVPENIDLSEERYVSAYAESLLDRAAQVRAEQTKMMAKDNWSKFWHNTGVVDFSACTDPRAPELERRVMLSQWLLTTQCTGDTPPQETGLTYNSWFGKFHLEMIWWHQSWLPLFNHPKKLARTLKWYEQAEPIARQIAERQGFKGIRWMKMTDPSATEAPSKVGSFLVWQQPHYIYLTELMRRTAKAKKMPAGQFKAYSSPQKMSDLIQKTAEFMGDFVTKETLPDGSYRYIIKGVIAAQETLRASETVNPPFEVAYWRFALELAQKDREANGLPRNELWDDIIKHLSPLKDLNGMYLASENALDTYTNERFTSDHMAVLGAIGVLPDSPLLDKEKMRATFHWIWDNWRWEKTWGWDHPMTAMCAARLGMPEKAVGALLMEKRTNTYLPNGHNFQDQRLRCYLPGNGGLLTAIAMMCAGWDGCNEKNPGFPKDGTWNVRWENLYPMP